jgi:hypothetical protein
MREGWGLLLLMRTLIRRAGLYAWHTIVVLSGLMLILSVFWVVSYGVSVHQRREAERLLQQLADLRPGVTGSGSVPRIAKEFHARNRCTGDLCDYDFENGFAFAASGLLSAQRRTDWDYVGLRPWRLTAHIQMSQDEIADVGFTAAIGRGRGWLYSHGLFSGSDWAWLMVSVEEGLRREQDYALTQAVKPEPQVATENHGIMVRKPSFDTYGSGEALAVRLSPSAPAESIKIAFDLNLRCATSISACTKLCQFAPSAWHSYSDFLASRGQWVDDPTECKQGPHP